MGSPTCDCLVADSDVVKFQPGPAELSGARLCLQTGVVGQLSLDTEHLPQTVAGAQQRVKPLGGSQKGQDGVNVQQVHNHEDNLLRHREKPNFLAHQRVRGCLLVRGLVARLLPPHSS